MSDLFAVPIERDVLRVTGPDALTFLQGQLSQDVAGLGDGESAWSLLLQPQGKVDALLRVTRLGAEEVVLDVDGGSGAAVAARLERFKLRIKADIEALAWACVAVRGPGAGGVASGDALRLPVAWAGVDGVDLLGPDVETPAGVTTGSIEDYEALRIRAGWPAMGSELTESTIPAEAGIVEATVSFTKGCYTGQELVARIDSRGGNVPRRLRGIVVGSGEHPPVGATVVAGEKEVGSLTSIAGSVGLGYVGRGVEPPADVALRWDGGETAARVESLPMVS